MGRMVMDFWITKIGQSLLLAFLTIGVGESGAIAQAPVPTLITNPPPSFVPEPEHQIEPTLPQVSFGVPTIELAQFRRGVCVNGTVGTSDRTINPVGTTIPSLWWTRDLLVTKPQFNPKLIEGWLVCGAGVQDAIARVCTIGGSRPGRVEMVVNTQLWTVLDYLSRYELINRFGTATSECGYNIYIFNTDTQLIADFTCDFQSDRRDRGCVLRSDLSGKGGLKRQVPDAFAAAEYRIEVR